MGIRVVALPVAQEVVAFKKFIQANGWETIDAQEEGHNGWAELTVTGRERTFLANVKHQVWPEGSNCKVSFFTHVPGSVRIIFIVMSLVLSLLGGNAALALGSWLSAPSDHTPISDLLWFAIPYIIFFYGYIWLKNRYRSFELRFWHYLRSATNAQQTRMVESPDDPIAGTYSYLALALPMATFGSLLWCEIRAWPFLLLVIATMLALSLSTTMALIGSSPYGRWKGLVLEVFTRSLQPYTVVLSAYFIFLLFHQLLMAIVNAGLSGDGILHAETIVSSLRGSYGTLVASLAPPYYAAVDVSQGNLQLLTKASEIAAATSNDQNLIYYVIVAVIGIQIIPLIVLSLVWWCRFFRIPSGWRSEVGEEISVGSPMGTLRPMPHTIGFSSRALLLLAWVISGMISIAGAFLSINVLYYIFTGSGIPNQAVIAPFAWVVSVCSAIIGQGAGQVVGSIILFVMASFVLFSVVLLFGQICFETIEGFFLIVKHRCVEPSIVTYVRMASRERGVRTPLVVVRREVTVPIKTRLVLPLLGLNVIEVSQPFFGRLTVEEQRSLLAHEIGHIAADAVQMWILQILSRLAVFGRGLLTITVDFVQREFRADEFSVRYNRDPESLVAALQKLQVFVAVSSIGSHRSRPGVYTERLRTGVANAKTILAEAYHFYFKEDLLAYAHPSLEDRVENIKRTSDMMNLF